MNKLLEQATKAIDAVFYDLSASSEQTKENMRYLSDEIAIKIDALNMDNIRRKK